MTNKTIIKLTAAIVVGLLCYGGVNLAEIHYNSYVEDQKIAEAEQKIKEKTEAIQWSWKGIETNKTNYRPCDSVVLTGYRESAQRGSLSLFEELVFIVGEKEIEVYRTSNAALVNKEEGLLPIPLQLPCESVDLQPGQYRWQGLVTLTTQEGLSKNFFWSSPNFQID